MADELRSLREELARIACKAYQRGLVFGTGGNVSVRIPGTGLALITATGVSLGDTTPDNLVTVDIATNTPTPDSTYKPSKETGFHMEVFRLRPEVNAVVHLHPPYGTAMSVSGEPLPLVTITAEVNLKHVPNIPCAISGSAELRQYVASKVKDFPEARAFLMCRHGTLTVGPNLVTAYNLSDLLEDSARAAYLVQQLRLPIAR